MDEFRYWVYRRKLAFEITVLGTRGHKTVETARRGKAVARKSVKEWLERRDYGRCRAA
jgi:hypothetical protein